jgi:hypothetical protein
MKFFLSHKQYGERPKGHRALHHLQPGWLFIEAGDWTLEVDYEPAQLKRAFTILCFITPLAGIALIAH